MGIQIPNPEPLANCPSLPIWLKRAGQTYLVFIDETFLQFFELNTRGYFCHAAVGIPEGEYANVRDEMQPIFERYKQVLVPELREFKHGEFKRIAFTERWSLAQRIHDVLYAHGAFISGFYTPANSFLLERVRVDFLDVEGVDRVPPDHKNVLTAKAAETKAGWTGPGMSDIIQQLLHTPVSGLLHFAAGVDVRIRILYDPREPKEDKAVSEAIWKVAGFVAKVTARTANRLTDVSTRAASEQEIGLQLADLAAGETRAFLEANRDLQEYGASPKLITPTSDEPIQGVSELSGRLFKVNAVTMMPGALQKRFFQKDPKERSVMPCFTDLLMSGMLTCFSTWGTPRHVTAYDRMIIDQLD